MEILQSLTEPLEMTIWQSTPHTPIKLKFKLFTHYCTYKLPDKLQIIQDNNNSLRSTNNKTQIKISYFCLKLRKTSIGYSFFKHLWPLLWRKLTRPLVFNGHLANCWLISFVKEANGGFGMHTIRLACLKQKVSIWYLISLPYCLILEVAQPQIKYENIIKTRQYEDVIQMWED